MWRYFLVLIPLTHFSLLSLFDPILLKGLIEVQLCARLGLCDLMLKKAAALLKTK